MKEQQKRITMLTAYDYTSAQVVDRAGIPVILVGDSLGMVVQGHTSTLPVTLDAMIYHTQAVVRGTQHALVVGDMPFLTYTTAEQALATAGRFLQEAGAHAVKLEGGTTVAPIVARLTSSGIPVMGHIGFTPQSVNQIGQRVQGKHAAAACQLMEDALALQAAGAFAMVLELIPAALASDITARLHIPTIGIGAGSGCDGQVQVFHDVLGIYDDFVPRHARRYATLAETMVSALQQFRQDVTEAVFPTAANSSTLDEQTLNEAHALFAQRNNT